MHFGASVFEVFVSGVNAVFLCPGLYSPLWALVGFVIVIFLMYWLVLAFEL